jgi:hypothetical protein
VKRLCFCLPHNFGIVLKELQIVRLQNPNLEFEIVQSTITGNGLGAGVTVKLLFGSGRLPVRENSWNFQNH